MKKKLLALLLAVIMVVSLFPVMTFAEDVVLGNNEYPYAESGQDEDGNILVTLSPVIASGTTENYQWEYSTTKNGTYRNIADDDNVASGAATANLTIIAAGEYDEDDNFVYSSKYDQKWIKCVVDGIETKPVQIIKGEYKKTKGGAIITKYNDYWYVTDGNMMYNYVPSESYFDIMGKYAGVDGKNYWLPTTFGAAWYISTSDSETPVAVDYNDDPAYLDSFNVGFDGENGLAFEIVLGKDEDGNEQISVGFGDDLYFGDSNAMGGTNPDHAALKAVLNSDGVAEQFQIVGVEDLSNADGDTASFVLRPATAPNYFGIGYYNDIKLYSYYTSTENSYTTRTIGGTDDVVYEVVKDTDTGMTVSWVNVPVGEDGKRTVKFYAKIGTVEETGASISDEPYDVTFMNWNGSEYVQYGDKLLDQSNGSRITKPADPAPANTGDVFGGWYTAQEGGRLWDFNSRVYTDKTLYARWHNATKVEGKAPDCSIAENGWKDYYECKNCGHTDYFEDAACTKLIENLNNWMNGDGKILAQHHLVADADIVMCDVCKFVVQGTGMKSENISVPGLEGLSEEEKKEAINNIIALVPAEILEGFASKNVEIALNANQLDSPENETEAEEIKEQYGAGNLVFYEINLSIYKTKEDEDGTKVQDGDATPVHELGGEGIKLCIEATEDNGLLFEDNGTFTRQYYVIRFHDGEVKIIPANYVNGKIEFISDKFSEYAIMYVDTPVVKKTYGTTITIGEERIAEAKAAEEAETNPDTGAPAMNMGGVAILLGIACVAFKKH